MNWEVTEFRYLTEIDTYLAPVVRGYEYILAAEVQRIAMRYAPLIQQWMQQNAPWQNRSGLARAQLMAKAARPGESSPSLTEYGLLPPLEGVVYIVFGWRLSAPGRTNPPWGAFLEHAKHLRGKYRVVLPALEHFLPLVAGDVEALLHKLGVS